MSLALKMIKIKAFQIRSDILYKSWKSNEKNINKSLISEWTKPSKKLVLVKQMVYNWHSFYSLLLFYLSQMDSDINFSVDFSLS